MKKIWTAIIMLTLFLVAGMHTWAGTFDDYWDFEEGHGIYAYAFPRIRISMDETWYKKTRVVLGEDGATASFYHKDSYTAYEEEGLTGGLLFTLGASVNTDFEDLPGFVYLGFDEEEAMNYYAVLPTDYQAYADDEKIRAEYDELWSGVEDVLDTALIRGSEKYKERDKTPRDFHDSPQEIISSAGYDYSINEDKKTITIVRYTGDEEAVGIPSEIDDYQVTEIGAEAFRYRKLKSVSFPETVRKIGLQAFEYCTISDDLLLPENAGIMDNAFSYATLPAAVTIPAGTTVEKCAFSYCQALENVFIEPGVVVRGRGFGYCDDLALVICADGSRLEKNAFEYCRGLEKVILCGSVEAPENAFYDCSEPEMTAAKESEFDTLKASAAEHIPQKGEYLYQALGDENLEKIKEEPPAELSFHVDQGGYGRTATFTEGEALDRAVELLCGIRIGEESGEWVTDNYNGIYLTWKDGSYTGISLNLRNLEHSVHSTLHTYELENLDEFWSYAADYLTEDE
ncbi:MAG: leucine-rich repeat domain-containing protein [Lachnospiraceae bacterium]|nr:leucine-rich repeat domain-containing protein [Lachnospiraceae bacterium]